MRTIWKFPLDIYRRQQNIRMPFEAKILHLGLQQGVPCIWAEVHTPVHTSTERRFEIAGTGHDHPTGYSYIGTFVLDEIGFVGHVYETTL